jgi:hypothetical protein
MRPLEHPADSEPEALELAARGQSRSEITRTLLLSNGRVMATRPLLRGLWPNSPVAMTISFFDTSLTI